MGVLDKLSGGDKKKNKSYKERNGTTRVGDALRWLGKQGKEISPILLDMTANLTGIAGLREVGDAIRNDGKLSQEDKELLLKEMEHDMIEMQEVTKRLKIDSDHTITRMVRPVTYFAMFLLFLFIVLFDGNYEDFTVNETYIPVIESLFGTMTVFYFGSRGIEKVVRTIRAQ